MSVMSGSVKTRSTKTGNELVEKKPAWKDRITVLSTKTDDDQS